MRHSDVKTTSFKVKQLFFHSICDTLVEGDENLYPTFCEQIDMILCELEFFDFHLLGKVEFLRFSDRAHEQAFLVIGECDQNSYEKRMRSD